MEQSAVNVYGHRTVLAVCEDFWANFSKTQRFRRFRCEQPLAQPGLLALVVGVGVVVSVSSTQYGKHRPFPRETPSSETV